jgi:hypothetical protein
MFSTTSGRRVTLALHVPTLVKGNDSLPALTAVVVATLHFHFAEYGEKALAACSVFEPVEPAIAFDLLLPAVVLLEERLERRPPGLVEALFQTPAHLGNQSPAEFIRVAFKAVFHKSPQRLFHRLHSGVDQGEHVW